ncbi:MAG: lipid-A-disaccharide synthase [Candidatus Absconditabacterales bacterium]|nr:lipid-A-disaccharide synthase [Candidatus Absconditabacterales bacterium]
MLNKIGLIAGSGRFPILLSKEIKKKGYEIIAIGIKGAADPELEKFVDKIFWVRFGELQAMIDFFKKENAKSLIMLGKVMKTALYTKNDFDARLIEMLKSVDEKNDEVLLSGIAREFLRDGLVFIDPSEFLVNFLPPTGFLTKRRPNEREMEDINFGFTMAKRLSDMDVGQVVVVKEQIVLAVEAIEGTDQAIPRGSKLGNGGVVVAKVSRPKQNMRFDIPVVGLTTLDILIKERVSALVLDSSTIVLDMDEFARRADENNIVIMVKFTGRKISRLFFATGELSGSLHAEHVIGKIKAINPSVVIDCIGGKNILKYNVNLIEDISNLSEMGFLEVFKFKIIMKYKKLLEHIKKYLITNRPDKVILMDASGMNFRIGKIAKELGIEVIYYIPPKVWVSKSIRRITKMKKICDKVITLFDFEQKIFEENGMESYFFGNPLVEIVKYEKKMDLFLAENPEITKDDKVILLLPGSRSQEVAKHIDEILKTAELLYEKDNSLKFVLIKALDVYFNIDPASFKFPLYIKDKNPYCWYKFAKFAVVCSGTATLEAAISNLPMAIVYKVNPITFLIAKSILNVKFAGLPNIVAGYEVVPEFLQKDFKAEKIANFIFEVMSDTAKYQRIKEELDQLVQKIYKENILENISAKILE